MRQCLALDLKDDPESIARYEAHHQRIWPQIAAHLRGQGVTAMEIYRIGNRLTMVMETDDAVFDAERMRAASLADPKVVGVGGADGHLPAADAVERARHEVDADGAHLRSRAAVTRRAARAAGTAIDRNGSARRQATCNRYRGPARRRPARPNAGATGAPRCCW